MHMLYILQSVCYNVLVVYTLHTVYTRMNRVYTLHLVYTRMNHVYTLYLVCLEYTRMYKVYTGYRQLVYIVDRLHTVDCMQIANGFRLFTDSDCMQWTPIASVCSGHGQRLYIAGSDCLYKMTYSECMQRVPTVYYHVYCLLSCLLYLVYGQWIV